MRIFVFWIFWNLASCDAQNIDPASRLSNLGITQRFQGSTETLLRTRNIWTLSLAPKTNKTTPEWCSYIVMRSSCMRIINHTSLTNPAVLSRQKHESYYRISNLGITQRNSGSATWELLKISRICGNGLCVLYANLRFHTSTNAHVLSRKNRPSCLGIF